MRGSLVDFRTVVGPILSESCASSTCHGGTAPAAELPLDDRSGERFAAAYENLFERDLVDRIGFRARRSALVECVLGEELDAAGSSCARCPDPSLTDRDTLTVIQWIESGALYDGSVDE
jgi:hypothetical protein